MKITAIYIRRSVGDKDNKSLSIESRQKADCIKSLEEGEEYRIYCEGADIIEPTRKILKNQGFVGLVLFLSYIRGWA